MFRKRGRTTVVSSFVARDGKGRNDYYTYTDHVLFEA